MMQNKCNFSTCRRWRYSLTTRWADGPTAVFIGMNPSIADETRLDPTLTRVKKRVESLGYGALTVCNVFAIVETDSRKLLKMITNGVDIIGPGNDAEILAACQGAELVLCGWGAPGRLLGRHEQILALFQRHGIKAHALVVNADGTPRHPLYVGHDVQPALFY